MSIDQLVPDYRKKLPPPPPDPNVIQVLEGAKQRVAKGWVQGAGFRGNKVCAAMAISMSINHVEESQQGFAFDRAGEVFLRAVNELFSAPRGRWHHVPEFNDFEGRTQGEVVEAFDRALKLAGKEG